MEYALDAADACREVGVKAVAVTAGYISPEPRVEFYRHMDAANVDLKGFTEDFYHRFCFARLGAVLETLEYLKHETNVWFEITNLLIPGANDSDQEIDAMTRWVVEHLGPDVPMHFTAFHPDFKMMDRPPTPPETLDRARRIALASGVRYAYTGNVHDAQGQSTYCHGCGNLVIERDWYRLGAYRLTEDGHCQTCGAKLPGVFDGPPGDWGPRRLPVRLAQVDSGGALSVRNAPAGPVPGCSHTFPGGGVAAAGRCGDGVVAFAPVTESLDPSARARIAVVREGFAAFSRGDLAWLQGLFSPEVVVRVPGQNRFSGQYSGAGEVLALVADALEILGGYSVRLLDVMGDHSLVCATFELELQRLDGASMQTVATQLFSFNGDDRIHETWIEVDDEAAIDRFLDASTAVTA